MITRREYLRRCAAAGVALTLSPTLLRAADKPMTLASRVIPGTQESLPVVGLGSSASFSRMAGEGDLAGVRAVLQAMVDGGGTVFDTAPSYGAAEAVAGQAAQEAGLAERLYWATKLNVARGGKADPAEARAQVEQSFQRIGKPEIDLIQVHNVADAPGQLAVLREFRDAGRVRHLGVTNTFESRYDELEAVMKAEPLDFIGVDYAVDNRRMEERIFPLAQDRGIGVLVYQPFGRARLWQRVEGHALPDWAGEYDIASWGQFFLKYALSHPAVTAVTPATSRPRHVIDNLGAGAGREVDAEGRQRMEAYLAAL